MTLYTIGVFLGQKEGTFKCSVLGITAKEASGQVVRWVYGVPTSGNRFDNHRPPGRDQSHNNNPFMMVTRRARGRAATFPKWSLAYERASEAAPQERQYE
jgi:hypothetical protein